MGHYASEMTCSRCRRGWCVCPPEPVKPKAQKAAPAKSRPQEEKYHAILTEITNAMQKLGRPWDFEDVKRLMLEQFAHDTDRPTGRLLPSLDGQRLVQTQLQSRKFGKEDASEFVEWLHAWCAINGVELSQ